MSDNPLSSASRRIGSKLSRASANGAPTPRPARRPWTLRIVPFFLLIPAIVTIGAGRFVDFAGLAFAFLCIEAAGICVERGQKATAAYDARKIAKAPPPWRLLAAILTAVGAFAAALLATSVGLFQSLGYGLVAGMGCVLAYGLDPSRAKRLGSEAARKAGVDEAKVIEVIDEAAGKIEGIERASARLKNPEHRARGERIVAQGRKVLAELERDPADIPRARRFLATYLDGAREVIEKFARQQDAPGGDEIEASFASVLATVERVFAEQVEHLERDEKLDLEVQIEVLETQMDKEGIR